MRWAPSKWLKKKLLGIYLKKLKCVDMLPSQELNAYEDLLLEINSLPGSGEYCFPIINFPPLWARKPLEERLDNLKIPMVFMYGENDYMWAQAARNVIKKNPGKANKVIII